jgi:hypothetical protein
MPPEEALVPFLTNKVQKIHRGQPLEPLGWPRKLSDAPDELRLGSTPTRRHGPISRRRRRSREIAQRKVPYGSQQTFSIHHVMDAIFDLAGWLNRRWWGKPFACVIYGGFGVFTLVCVLFLLSIPGRDRVGHRRCCNWTRRRERRHALQVRPQLPRGVPRSGCQRLRLRRRLGRGPELHRLRSSRRRRLLRTRPRRRRLRLRVARRRGNAALCVPRRRGRTRARRDEAQQLWELRQIEGSMLRRAPTSGCRSWASRSRRGLLGSPV